MASVYSHADSNIRRTWMLMVTFLIVVIGLGWAASWYMQSPVILWVVVALALIMNITSYWFSDKIVLKISGAKPVTREQYFDLWNAVENLSITAGIPMPKVYIINDPAPNAFATGRNPEKGVVAVTTGLLSMMDKNELEGVIAHELSHIKNRDILVMTVAVVLVGFVTLLSDFFLRWTLWGGGGGNNDSRGGQLQMILIVAGLVLAILSPIIAQLIKLAISRKREYLADASGALLTRYPEGLASALEKIGAYKAPMKNANHAMAHMYISNPFGAKARKGFNSLFMTHPDVADRIRVLRESA